jgi:hypothetical protein
MSTRRDKFAGGLTLIEVMVAVGVIAFAVVGGMGLRYYSSLDARKADVYVSASRVGWMLLEQWRAFEGAEDFDPGKGGGPIQISSSSGPSPTDSDLTVIGSWRVDMGAHDGGGPYYYATLSYKDDTSVDGLRILNVRVAWPESYPLGGRWTPQSQVAMATKVQHLP